LIGNGLWQAIVQELQKFTDYNYIITNVQATINEVYKYKNSILGILDAVN
jgi:hypothetical protein